MRRGRADARNLVVDVFGFLVLARTVRAFLAGGSPSEGYAESSSFSGSGAGLLDILKSFCSFEGGEATRVSTDEQSLSA